MTIDKLIEKYKEMLQIIEEEHKTKLYKDMTYPHHSNQSIKLILQDLEELKNKCPHSKKYDDLIRCSNPPKRQWVCQICGEVGYDTIGVDKDEQKN